MNVLSSFMAVVIWEGNNLIQEPSWQKQPLKINLLGWESSAEQPEGGTGMRVEPPTGVSGEEHRNQDAAFLVDQSLCPALPSSPTWILPGMGKLIWLVFCTGNSPCSTCLPAAHTGFGYGLGHACCEVCDQYSTKQEKNSTVNVGLWMGLQSWSQR